MEVALPGVSAGSPTCLSKLNHSNGRLSFLHTCVYVRAAGDIRLELLGTDLLITGKQGVTGGYKQAQISPYDLALRMSNTVAGAP